MRNAARMTLFAIVPLFMLSIIPPTGSVTIAGQPQGKMDGSLELIASYPRADLDSPTSVAVSPDGKFLYVSSFQSATHVVFRRDVKSGKLEHVQSVLDPVLLKGATALRLNHKGNLAVANAFTSKAIVLYHRDAATGKLTYLDNKRDQDPGVSGMEFAIGVKFTPDDRFAYVIDARGGITAFEIVGKDKQAKLKFVESFRSPNLNGVRGLAIHPSGKVMFATCHLADTLVMLTRDKKTGKMQIKQILREGQGNIEGLEEAFGVCVSSAGRFVYTVSGRFGGDDAVGVFRFDEVGMKLVLVEEIIRGRKDKITKKDVLADFQGGNEIAVSPDRDNVYAAATKSGAVAVFSRHPRLGTLNFVQLVQAGNATNGAAGIAVSPDGRFVYVAAEFGKAVSVFRRMK